MPKKTAVPNRRGDHLPPDDCEREEIGRIVAESSSSTSSLAARGRESSSILVECISKEFVRACSSQAVGSSSAGFSHELRRVAANKLLHTTSLHGVLVDQEDTSAASLSEESKVIASAERAKISESDSAGGPSEQVLENLKKVKNMESSAIECIRKECENNATALAVVVEAGLANSLLFALDSVAERISIPDEKESVSQFLSAIGKLSHLIAQTAFPETNPIQETESVCSAPSPQHGSSSDNEDEGDRQGLQMNDIDSDRLDQLDESAFSQDFGRDIGRDGRLSSAQQRRNILLALMSRARRVNPDVLSRDLQGSSRSPSTGNAALPSLDQFRNDAAALLFGVRGDWEENSGDVDEDMPSHENAASAAARNRNASSRNTSETRTRSQKIESSVLDGILRGRSQKSRASLSSGKTNVPSTLLRSAISNGLLGNSLQWLKAVSQAQNKKTSSKPTSKSGTWLKSATDEDGMPLLQLAISMGCSTGIVDNLVRMGAVVTDAEIKLAARFDLPEILSLLLQGSVYHEGTVDAEKCSQRVARVIAAVIQRQKRQEASVRTEATSLLAQIIQRLISLCLQVRYQHDGAETCSQAIADALVGNVMLSALQQQQKNTSSNSGSGTQSDVLQLGDRSAGSSKTLGILANIPQDVFGIALLLESHHLTNFLLLCESYLCSKDINDSAIGLSLLSILLKDFPSFGRSSEVERFGFVELLSSHDAFASNRLAEIASNAVPRKSNLTTVSALANTGVVVCPKQHTAHLHVTMHSSFRCDLCGKGVDKNRVMHGCRECDWDACERCTDEAEGGVVKWNHIRELAAGCQRLLSQPDHKDEKSSFTDQRMEKYLAEMDNSPEINNLSIRLLQRDPSSIKALESVLDTKGKLTLHQFISVILPALHASVLGKPNDNSESNLIGENYHRNKKARVGGAPQAGDNETIGSNPYEDKMEFARHLFFGHCLRKDGSIGDDDNDDKVMTDGEKDRNGFYKPELLRRLHQVLSLYENVPSLPNVHNRVGRGGLKLGELQSLTKPLQLRLTPIAKQKGTQGSRKVETTVNLDVEPLTSVEDLSNHILRTCKVSNSLYSTFCRG